MIKWTIDVQPFCVQNDANYLFFPKCLTTLFSVSLKWKEASVYSNTLLILMASQSKQQRRHVLWSQVWYFKTNKKAKAIESQIDIFPLIFNYSPSLEWKKNLTQRRFDANSVKALNLRYCLISFTNLENLKHPT